MYKILEVKELAANIYLMEVEAKRIAKRCEPGQFIIVRTDEEGERIPLTICDYDREKGTVTIVFQTVGAGTVRMAELKAGDCFHDFVGPLGCPSEFVHESLEELKKTRPTSVLLQMFADSKLDEVVAIYSKATTTEKQEGYKMLSSLYPAMTTRLEPLKK